MMSIVQDVDGRVEATEGFGAQQSPAVLRGAVGLGRVIFVPFDLDQPPFVTWPDRPRLLGKLLDVTLDSTGGDEDSLSEREGNRRASHDLSGQLSDALDRFQNVRLVPFYWIAGLMALYIVLVGPADFWLLRRVQRSHWTWFTSAAIMLGFLALSYLLTILWKGNEFRVNLVSVVDADLTSGMIRGTTWAHLFSPRTQRSDVTTRPLLSMDWRPLPLQQTTIWQGRPGDSFGGLDREARQTSAGESYRVALDLHDPDQADVRLEAFPMTARSSQSLVSQWWGVAAWKAHETRLTADGNSSLSGTIVNPWPGDLQDAYLVYEGAAIRLGQLRQNGRITLRDAVGIDLQTLLTQRKVLDGHSVMTPWDPDTADIDRVVPMLMYYQAAKGRPYTRALHRYHRWLDWSDHAQLQQAVLWGRSDLPTAEVFLDNQTIAGARGTNWLRLLIPVNRPAEE
jgi:hypothetical protein